jgi:flavorubredoxin
MASEVEVKAIELAEKVHWVGALDPELRVFDINVKTDFGTTYNSYLVQGEKSALIDGVKAGFEDQLFDRLAGLTSVEQLDYLVINHTEPDHTGALRSILERNPTIEFICAAPALPFLKNVLNDNSVRIRTVKEGGQLDLGGMNLEFISAPFLHWPDTMFTYLTEEKILFSCDAYGAHFAPKDDIFYQPGDETIDHEVWYYYDCIMRPYAPHCRKATLKVKDREIKIVAPSHGAVNAVEPKRFIEKYLEWTEIKKPSDRPLVIVAYASSYGNTGRLANILAEVMGGMSLDVRLVNVFETTAAEQRDLFEAADALLFGSPTFVNDAVKPIWDSLHLLPTVACAGKKAGVFGSYGWGGQAVAVMEGYLQNLKLKLHEESFRVRLVPSADDLEACRAFARTFGEFVTD